MLCGLQGGNEQYQICPRSIEFVVSTTKHFPTILSGIQLDKSNCISFMRTFDRKAWQASIDLLTKATNSGGSSDDDNKQNDAVADDAAATPEKDSNSVDDVNENTVLTANNNNHRPFRFVKEIEEDKRLLSIRYYLVLDNWKNMEGAGGNLTFQQPRGDSTTTTITTVQAKRDRLVLWKSDTTLYRTEPWWVNNNSQETMKNDTNIPNTASCIELHLLDGR